MVVTPLVFNSPFSSFSSCFLGRCGLLARWMRIEEREKEGGFRASGEGEEKEVSIAPIQHNSGEEEREREGGLVAGWIFLPHTHSKQGVK